MKIAILGSGMVGNALATKLVQIGQQVMMGSRTANSEAGQQWLKSVGGKAQIGTFADAAKFGEIIISCTNGSVSLEALRQAGASNLRGKIIMDVSNPLAPNSGMPPALAVCNTDSLGEQIQREFPDSRVVKAFNTINCDVMVQPSLVPGEHHLPICGNDAAAKREVVSHLCEWFGWTKESFIDLGDITNARGTEMYLALWMRLWRTLGTPQFNIRIVRAK